jgi:hypothetical protein
VRDVLNCGGDVLLLLVSVGLTVSGDPQRSARGLIQREDKTMMMGTEFMGMWVRPLGCDDSRRGATEKILGGHFCAGAVGD